MWNYPKVFNVVLFFHLPLVFLNALTFEFLHFNIIVSTSKCSKTSRGPEWFNTELPLENERSARGMYQVECITTAVSEGWSLPSIDCSVSSEWDMAYGGRPGGETGPTVYRCSQCMRNMHRYTLPLFSFSKKIRNTLNLFIIEQQRMKKRLSIVFSCRMFSTVAERHYNWNNMAAKSSP